MKGRWMVGGVTVAAVAAGIAAMSDSPHPRVIASYATPLEGRKLSQRHNAQLAVDELNGAIIRPGAEFSFNKRVGSFSRDEGYRKAPVSYNGQLIDSWGGGVCQASTTLYNAALLGGMNVTERNRHRFAPSYVPPGRDAAVAFSNIDLRFINPHPFPVRLRASLTNGMLRCDLIADYDLPTRPTVVAKVEGAQSPPTYRIGSRGLHRVRNTGKPGFDVAVYRITGDHRELISSDNYPSMGRVIEFEKP